MILIESLDLVMYNNIVNCTLGKQIWETIEILCEGSAEVKDNQSKSLSHSMKVFMAKANESITEDF